MRARQDASPFCVMPNDSFAHPLYASTAWKKTRAAYMKSVHGLCEECLKQGLVVPATQVHHKVHLTPENVNDPSVTLNWDNLEALCDEHHAQAHKGRGKNFLWDDFGNILPPTDPPRR